LLSARGDCLISCNMDDHWSFEWAGRISSKAIGSLRFPCTMTLDWVMSI
jgi:hypothetical protein